MKTPFTYYGGKQGMAREIVALMPEHSVYMEPFFGSGAVLMAKKKTPFEIVNDIDHALVAFWRVLRDRPDDLERVCALTPYSRAEYESCDLTASVDDLELARRWWVRVNQSFACTANDHTGWSITVATGNSKPNQVLHRLGRFAQVAERIAGLNIECCDAADLVTRLANDSTVVYADPPYLSSTRTGEVKKGGVRKDYRHDMGTDDDHERLASALRATTAKVILSGYPSPVYDALYAGWHRIDRPTSLRSSNAARGARQSGGRVESLWLNFEPAHIPARLDFGAAS